MWFNKRNKEHVALKRIKSLQQWLNKNFPETLPAETMNDYKFVEAEDFLTEEARRWNEYKQLNKVERG